MNVKILPAHCLLPRSRLQVVRFTAQRTMCAKFPVGETANTSTDALRANVAMLLYIQNVQGSIRKPDTCFAEMYSLRHQL